MAVKDTPENVDWNTKYSVVSSELRDSGFSKFMCDDHSWYELRRHTPNKIHKPRRKG